MAICSVFVEYLLRRGRLFLLGSLLAFLGFSYASSVVNCVKATRYLDHPELALVWTQPGALVDTLAQRPMMRLVAVYSFANLVCTSLVAVPLLLAALAAGQDSLQLFTGQFAVCLALRAGFFVGCGQYGRFYLAYFAVWLESVALALGLAVLAASGYRIHRIHRLSSG